MEISPRKPSKRAQEPVDEWLQTKGYFRKHAPRDPTCLFRAVSEQIYTTQHYHLRVRKECVEFMRELKQSFFENIVIPFEDYLEQMACFTEWGGMNEIQAMSLLYKREFVIFNGQKQIQRNVTNNGFKDAIYLCHTPQKQYESIYTQDFVASAAYCQSIVYQILYKDVFNMANIESTVHKMLHDRTATFRHDKFFLKGNLELRDQLTAEIYNKADNGNDEVDDAQGIVKNIPPFPYRVAKALDPNIYRNTDFDIWHEIRREVKNAGWTRHNSNELQVGGKCLVQMNFNEEDIDKANNNNICVSSLENDVNCNDTKALQKKDKQDPIFLYGHIQEMSKNQGPVLVFIEELGEKKVVPYLALKPLPLKKSKQNNWLPVCKRNVLLDTNQKWKKPYSGTSRKVKQSISNGNISPGNIDKNGNNNNCSNEVNKNNDWKEGSLKIEHTQAYENYGMEKYTNYSTSTEMFPSRMNLDNTQSLGVDVTKPENAKGHKEKNSFGKKNAEKHSVQNSKPDNVMNSDNNTGFNSYSNQRTQNENYYPSYSGEPVSVTQVDNMLRSINCSVQKSVDVNGSDLPLSDPFTLRFFYNLGLECFRGSNNWNYLTNEQSADFEQWYQDMPQSEDEVTNISNGVMQHCTLTQGKQENNIDQNENSSQSFSQESGEKCVNRAKDMQIQRAEPPKTDNRKDVSYSPREKVKDQESVNRDSSRLNRNSLGPRFKKSSDGRYRTASQFTQSSNQYPHCGSNSKSSKSPEMKGDSASVQPSRVVPYQVHGSATAAVNSYQTSYMQQGVYSGMPYYANEAEAFANPYYAPNPGFFPIPCLPHSDIPDNSNVQPFSPHLCQGIDYTQAYSGMCPPYICPQPAPYSIPPQNMQEHWYAVAGQPHYMQYAPVLPVTADAGCNGLTQNINQNNQTPECMTMQVCSNL
nr:GATA zinc finger domain-containing protein 14-like isoform X2 [Nomia melanderi]